MLADGGVLHAARSGDGRGVDSVDLNSLQQVEAPNYNLSHPKVRTLAVVNVEKYGEENAEYLWEQIGGYSKNYGKLTFIEMGVEPDDSFERATESEAAERGMGYEKVRGDMVLIERLVNGDWEGDDFLVIKPGHRVVARYDERIIETEPAT